MDSHIFLLTLNLNSVLSLFIKNLDGGTSFENITSNLPVKIELSTNGDLSNREIDRISRFFTFKKAFNQRTLNKYDVIGNKILIETGKPRFFKGFKQELLKEHLKRHSEMIKPSSKYHLNYQYEKLKQRHIQPKTPKFNYQF